MEKILIELVEVIRKLNYWIAGIFLLSYAYHFFYVLVVLIFGKKETKIEKGSIKLHKYAVLIAARNEEKVIKGLLRSIKEQTYPNELIKVFLVADNCTDKTSEVANSEGAIVYQRYNQNYIGKGYALEFLLEKIKRDYGNEEFDGYFVFDADNILDERYIEEMNKVFSQGYKIITSYRNSKNYETNWISAGYGLWFLREAKFLNEPRMLLKNSCIVTGTGFVFSREILQKTNGWKFHSLTEDLEFSIYHIINGETIGYCKEAIFYDEQPETFSQSWKQRMRWIKGYYQVFNKYKGELVKKLLETWKFTYYDITILYIPALIFSMLSFFTNTSILVVELLLTGNIKLVLALFFTTFFNSYILLFLMGALTTITEWRKIYCSNLKKIMYIFTFPIFTLTYFPIACMALFKKVKWEPIIHTRANFALKR